jgi:hypothetical protein
VELTVSLPASDKGRFRLIEAPDLLSQKAAQQTCRAEGGNLASIHSQQALNLVHSMTWDLDWSLSRVWIGLYSEGPGKPLKWYDGSPVDFAKLAFDFPQKTQAITGALSVASKYAGSAYYYHEKDAWAALCKLP